MNFKKFSGEFTRLKNTLNNSDSANVKFLFNDQELSISSLHLEQVFFSTTKDVSETIVVKLSNTRLTSTLAAIAEK